jgi:hypothetical protein
MLKTKDFYAQTWSASISELFFAYIVERKSLIYGVHDYHKNQINSPN